MTKKFFSLAGLALALLLPALAIAQSTEKIDTAMVS
jgi:hypothetical protein